MKIYLHFLTLLKTEMPRVVKIIAHRRNKHPISLRWYHGCRCPDDARSQVISSLGVDLILMENSGFVTNKIEYIISPTFPGLVPWGFPVKFPSGDGHITSLKIHQKPWWSHQMGTFSVLLALCEGNPTVTGGFPSQRPVTQCFDVFFDLHLNKLLS